MDWKSSHPWPYNTTVCKIYFLHMPGRLDFFLRMNAMQFLHVQLNETCHADSYWQNLIFAAETMKQWLQLRCCFWPTLFSQCEFDAVNLIWMTHTNREAPCQVEPMSTSSPPFGIKLANRALEHVPCKSRCGTLGACTRFPRKDIQLRVWFVCWFGFYPNSS